MQTKSPDVWTITRLLTWSDDYFQKHAIDSPRLTGELLLAHSLGIKRIDLYLQYDRPLNKDELSSFKLLIQKRIQKQPLAYITGKKGFYESDFTVTKDVLIPRPDTETIVEQALKTLNGIPGHPPKKILELGCGSGAIIISLADKFPDHHFFASDVSPNALKVAQKNSGRINQTPISFFASNWFSSIKERQFFDLIVSNPPYIPSKEIDALQPEIRLFEPMLALDGGSDGLSCYRTILENACRFLVPGGTLLLEMGADQKKGLLEIIHPYFPDQPVEFIRDLAGHNRVAVIQKGSKY